MSPKNQIEQMKRLSKSRYTTYCQCPKALWLKVYKPDEATVDASVEARFESGNEVGDLAMGLFGPFVEVTTEPYGRAYCFRPLSHEL